MTIYEYNARLNEERLPILREGAKYNIDGRVSYNSPEDLARLAMDTIGLSDAAEEFAYIIAMDTRNRIIGLFEVGHGTVDAAFFDRRGAFQKLLMLGAVRFAMVHNHPSGMVNPSREDRDVTANMKQGAETLGLSLLDHIIIGDRCYYSFADQGEL